MTLSSINLRMSCRCVISPKMKNQWPYHQYWRENPWWIRLLSERGDAKLGMETVKLFVDSCVGELLGVTPEQRVGQSMDSLSLGDIDSEKFWILWTWTTSFKTAFIRLLLDSNSSIVFSMFAINDFFLSLVIFACILLRSRLHRMGTKRIKIVITGS